MADFLARGLAPLSPEQWQAIDRSVVEAARRQLVGRRFIPIYGPVGPGMQAIVDEVYTGSGSASVSMASADEGQVIRPSARQMIQLPIIFKDFTLSWRNLEASSQFGLPLDLGGAISAAVNCARAEDDLIFNGDAALRIEGLLNAGQRTTIPMSDWGSAGGAFQDVVAAINALLAAGFPGPYALVTSPGLYAAMNRVFENTGLLEIQQVRGLVTDGVFQSAVLPEPAAVLVADGAENLDLVIAQDLTTAYLESRAMNQFFRVFEVLGLRVKRPGAICTIEGGAPQAGERRRVRRTRDQP